jgi:Tfp pilus assembly protein PilN
MKIRINLYGEEFRPRRQWATLPQMVAGWVLALLVVAGCSLLIQQLKTSQQTANQQQELALNALRLESERLIAEQARHKPDAELSRQNKQMQHELQIKQQLVNSLTAREMLKSNGFAVLLSDLARIRSRGIALQHIQLEEGRLELSGLASSSQDVPAWVNRFAETESLTGKEFSELQISRDGSGQLSFHLSSPLVASSAPGATTAPGGKKS